MLDGQVLLLKSLMHTPQKPIPSTASTFPVVFFFPELQGSLFSRSSSSPAHSNAPSPTAADAYQAGLFPLLHAPPLGREGLPACARRPIEGDPNMKPRPLVTRTRAAGSASRGVVRLCAQAGDMCGRTWSPRTSDRSMLANFHESTSCEAGGSRWPPSRRRRRSDVRACGTVSAGITIKMFSSSLCGSSGCDCLRACARRPDEIKSRISLLLVWFVQYMRTLCSCEIVHSEVYVLSLFVRKGRKCETTRVGSRPARRVRLSSRAYTRASYRDSCWVPPSSAARHRSYPNSLSGLTTLRGDVVLRLGREPRRRFSASWSRTQEKWTRAQGDRQARR